MQNNIIHHAKHRHTAKAYDPTKKISTANIEKIKDLLRHSPSSVNSQPWHFILASTEAGKNKIAQSTDDKYAFNSANIRNASHVVIFCSKIDIDDAYVNHLLDQEEKDGRFINDPKAQKERQLTVRNTFINLRRQELNDLPHWIDKQVYLNVDQFLLGVAALGIDATPMEGIDTDVLDSEFALHDKGYRSLVVVTLGHHHADNDFNAKLPKSRLPMDEMLTEV